MCEYYWQKRGDKWVMVLAEEDELFAAKDLDAERVSDFEFPPVKPALEEPQSKRRPRALMR